MYQTNSINQQKKNQKSDFLEAMKSVMTTVIHELIRVYIQYLKVKQ
ncbi:hypothetical protein V757_01945 [Pelistega indica]|uniref:Uncharacterized protein n=1 Tax=Pelistega indica TaxID=1414851 RepID=V8G8S5_9BURK|nr:hypothetical protein V757_01945 [Pelistega indica]